MRQTNNYMILYELLSLLDDPKFHDIRFEQLLVCIGIENPQFNRESSETLEIIKNKIKNLKYNVEVDISRKLNTEHE